MDFWNDNTTFVAQNEKCGLKKYVKVVSKYKLKNMHHQMKSLLVKCIEIFLIYIFKILKVLNDVIVANFYSWESISQF